MILENFMVAPLVFFIVILALSLLVIGKFTKLNWLLNVIISIVISFFLSWLIITLLIGSGQL